MRFGLSVLLMSTFLMQTDDATAQVETLLMPGEVIEGHAEIEAECSSCHQRFERTRQRALCLDCHDDVAADIDGRNGYHGLFESARNDDCSDCHTDHEGRDAVIVELDEDSFDHAYTDFLLDGEHATVECDDCHAADTRYRDAPDDCDSCHREDSQHGDTFASRTCAGCHVTSGWEVATFDHDTTGFVLIGRHTETGCLDCHEDQTFIGAPTDCYGCHAADDAHDGLSGRDCGNCHNPRSWEDTSFDHSRDTDFPLEGAHSRQECAACHSDDPFGDALDATCISCHAEDDNHDRHFGEACDTCHISTEWTSVVFDHSDDTGHALLGAHADATCEACHIEPVFEVALQSDCLSCHEDDDAHEGTQGIVCSDCHGEFSWTDDLFFDHDLTGFPLLGAHAGEACEGCHDSHVFTDAPTDCASCHREDDAHDGRFADNCAQCHNPVDWLQWTFDHDTQTDFLLDGAHALVACDSCHRGSLERQATLGQRCADCHRSDDVHDGEFGFDCGRCHSSDSFGDVRAIQ